MLFRHYRVIASNKKDPYKKRIYNIVRMQAVCVAMFSSTTQPLQHLQQIYIEVYICIG